MNLYDEHGQHLRTAVGWLTAREARALAEELVKAAEAEEARRDPLDEFGNIALCLDGEIDLCVVYLGRQKKPPLGR